MFRCCNTHLTNVGFPVIIQTKRPTPVFETEQPPLQNVAAALFDKDERIDELLYAMTVKGLQRSRVEGGHALIPTAR